jgi:hypothetical protein
MGTFNVLTAPVACRSCQQVYQERIQFKFGDLWQHEYVLGDELLWDRNNEGEPGVAHVVVLGISELDACPHCGLAYLADEEPEYDLHIVENVLCSVRPVESYELYGREDRFYLPLP